MESPFASWMGHYISLFPDNAPECDGEDSLAGLLQVKGDVHEHAVLESFINDGMDVVDLSGIKDVDASLNAMQKGGDVIFQATLEKPPFRGYADSLRTG